MRTLIAFLLLASVVVADPPAERAKALRRDLLIVKKADLKAANEAAVVALGPANANMFSVGFRKAGNAETPSHYVASVRMTSVERAKFDKAFTALLTAGKVNQYQKCTVKAKLTELDMAPVEK